MAASAFTAKIEELTHLREQKLAAAKRASERRRAHLARRERPEARAALRTARVNRREARELLKRIRILRKERKARNALLRAIRHNRKVIGSRGQLSWFDGKMVRSEIVPHLKWARAHGWRGVVTSGYRDPVYSQKLCYAMCGHPVCPGRCAGTSSNHVRTAVDVTDYGTFGRLMESCPYSPRLFNDLPIDPVHFSPNGR